MAPTAATIPASTKSSTFAIRTLYMGDSPRGSQTREEDAWKKFGYDLDGVETTKAEPKQCKPLDGNEAIPDADKGVDNAFGYALLPTLSTVGTLLHKPTKNMTDAIARGDFTIMFQVTGLDDAASQTSTGLQGQLFSGAKFDATNSPAWNGLDAWPVDKELLVDGETVAGGSKIKFTDAFVTGGTWVNGSPTSMVVALTIGKFPFALRIQRAIVTAEHSAPNKLSNGVIAGVIAINDVLQSIDVVAGSINASACPGTPTHDLIVRLIRQAADVRIDKAVEGDCDAISIGLGFEAESVAAPTAVAAAVAAPPNSCPPAATPAAPGPSL